MQKKNKSKKTTSRNKNDFKNESFESVYSELNPNKAWNTLKNILFEKFNHHALLNHEESQREKVCLARSRTEIRNELSRHPSKEISKI